MGTIPKLEECNPGIRPVEYYVLIAPETIEERTAGGIYIPQAKRETAEILFALGQVHALLDNISERLEQREVSVREYVESTGISEKTVYVHLRNGTIPGRRIGRRWLVRAAL